MNLEPSKENTVLNRSKTREDVASEKDGESNRAFWPAFYKLHRDPATAATRGLHRNLERVARMRRAGTAPRDLRGWLAYARGYRAGLYT